MYDDTEEEAPLMVDLKAHFLNVLSGSPHCTTLEHSSFLGNTFRPPHLPVSLCMRLTLWTTGTGMGRSSILHL